MIAAGAYIRTLREARRMSRADLAAQVGTHESQLVRIEAGEQDTRGSMLLAIVRALRGSLHQVAELMAREDATVDDGRAAAQLWESLSSEERARIDVLVDMTLDMGDEEIRALVAEINRTPDPSGLARDLRALLRRLLGSSGAR